MSSDLYQEALQQKDRLIAVRRDLHAHPELGFQEVRTAGIVARELNALGLEVRTGVARTGVVGLLEGARPGPVTLLRFDMDALPVEEQTGAAYASLTPGVMHACGHDGHVAVGLTVARMLSARRDELRGSLKFVFQPAEEGLGGAEAVIADGVLERPRVDRSLALHVWNELLLGKVAIHAGPLMAGGEIFNARLEGRGGHGALPHQAVDPVLAAAQVTLALQSIVSRNVSPLQAAVVSVTRIQAGEAFNVIPPAAELTGTIRTFEAETRELVLRRFGEIVRGVGEAMGCRVTLDIRPVTPAVINDVGSAQALQEMARRDFPELQIDTQFRTMVSEDMAYLLERAPGVYFLVGAANPEKGLVYGHHHPKFDFDEDALIHAAALMAAAALELQHKDIDGK